MGPLRGEGLTGEEEETGTRKREQSREEERQRDREKGTGESNRRSETAVQDGFKFASSSGERTSPGGSSERQTAAYH